jgi:hypothetical protein
MTRPRHQLGYGGMANVASAASIWRARQRHPAPTRPGIDGQSPDAIVTEGAKGGLLTDIGQSLLHGLARALESAVYSDLDVSSTSAASRVEKPRTSRSMSTPRWIAGRLMYDSEHRMFRIIFFGNNGRTARRATSMRARWPMASSRCRAQRAFSTT